MKKKHAEETVIASSVPPIFLDEPIEATRFADLPDADLAAASDPPAPAVVSRRADGEKMVPSLGRILLFGAGKHEAEPGVVVGVNYATDGVTISSVDLVTFAQTGIAHRNGVPFAGETVTKGAAFWPPRV